MTIGVLGAGSWGTALALLLARNGHEVTLYGRDQDNISEIRSRRENPFYLPGFALPEELEIRSLSELSAETEQWILAVPLAAARSVMALLPSDYPHLCLASKGLEPGTALMLHEMAAEVIPKPVLSVLSGPNLAIELAQGIPTATVVASYDPGEAEKLACALSCRTLRVYLSNDVIGLELAGALKNVLAISAGMSDGLGFGDNTKGALLARGLKDMTLLGVALGAKPETFFGIAGVGDVFATAHSKLSRNYRVGHALGRGKSLAEALQEVGQVAEGVTTSESAVLLGRRHQVPVPIFEAVDAVIRGKVKPQEAVSLLMERQPKTEGFDWSGHGD